MKSQFGHKVQLLFAAVIASVGLYADRCLADVVCVANSGNTRRVCVGWAKQADPVLNTDFEVDYDCTGCSDAPDVELSVGDGGWAVYSEVISTGAVANIGALTTTDSEHYVVKIAKGAGAGAANVGSMVLTPSGDHYSSLASGSSISGNLGGPLTLKKTTGGSGGSLSLTVAGNVEGNITAATISSLSITGDLSGNLSADDITGSVPIGGDATGDIELWELSGSLTISGDIYHDVMLTYGSSGTITAGTVKAGALVKLAQGGDSFDGTATFTGVESAATVMTCMAALGGTIHVTTGNVAGTVATMALGSNPGLLDGALIDIDGNVSGCVSVSQDALGDIDIGGDITSSGKVNVYGDIDGEVTIAGDVEGGGEILGNSYVSGDGITGEVTVEGEFNGNICADNLSPLEDLPAEHVSIDDFGEDWLICGARPGCGDGTISSADPADGTHDSRQPHPPGDCSLSARQGIGSSSEPIEITLSEGGANNVVCWALCETGIETVDTGQGCSTLSANAVKSVTETSTGVYEIVLERPISAGHWTTITYVGDDSYVTYASLPADAEAEGHSGPDDILALINYLNEVDEPPYGNYSCDIDHSSACGSPDTTRLIDLLNGASKFIAWYNKTLPSNTCP